MDPTGQKPGLPPGGWSADPYGSGTSKWGDSAGQAEGDTGTQSPLAARIPGLRLPRPMLGAHVPVYNPYIWMLLAVPVLAARGDVVRMVATILHRLGHTGHYGSFLCRDVPWCHRCSGLPGLAEAARRRGRTAFPLDLGLPAHGLCHRPDSRHQESRPAQGPGTGMGAHRLIPPDRVVPQPCHLDALAHTIAQQTAG